MLSALVVWECKDLLASWGFIFFPAFSDGGAQLSIGGQYLDGFIIPMIIVEIQ